MSRGFAFCTLLLAILMVCPVQAQEPSLAPLKAWEGHYPFDKIGGKTLWDNAAFQAKAKAVLGDKEYGHLFGELKNGVVDRVVSKDGVMSFFLCAAHACMLDSFTVFVDFKTDRLFFCRHNDEAKGDYWLAQGAEPVGLEDAACLSGSGYNIFQKQVRE